MQTLLGGHCAGQQIQADRATQFGRKRPGRHLDFNILHCFVRFSNLFSLNKTFLELETNLIIFTQFQCLAARHRFCRVWPW